MFSPPNHPTVTAWFARLDAAWRRMPAEERDRQREEIEQHLEGLVAANVVHGQSLEDAWEAALVQFGDPTQIGRKMYQEWQQGKPSFRADIKAILFGIGLYLLLILIQVLLLNPVWFRLIGTQWNSIGFVAFVIGKTIGYTSILLLNVTMGRKYPYQALKSVFYANVANSCLDFTATMIGFLNSRVPISVHALIPHIVLIPLFLLRSTGIAYLASVTRRGWYRPSLADFKITLPRRRWKIAR